MGVRQGADEVVGAEALAQREDLARVVPGRPGLRLLERGQKHGGALVEGGEGRPELLEVGAAVGVPWAVPVEDRSLLRAARQQRVSGDAGQVRAVDEELVLGDAQRQDRSAGFARSPKPSAISYQPDPAIAG